MVRGIDSYKLLFVIDGQMAREKYIDRQRDIENGEYKIKMEKGSRDRQKYVYRWIDSRQQMDRQVDWVSIDYSKSRCKEKQRDRQL